MTQILTPLLSQQARGVSSSPHTGPSPAALLCATTHRNAEIREQVSGDQTERKATITSQQGQGETEKWRDKRDSRDALMQVTVAKGCVGWRDMARKGVGK